MLTPPDSAGADKHFFARMNIYYYFCSGLTIRPLHRGIKRIICFYRL